MGGWFRNFNLVLNCSSSFFSASAVLVFLHCFYDRGFLWNRKKAFLLLAAAVLESCLLVLENSVINFLTLVILTLTAVYDYRGKKLRSLYFLLAFSIVTLCTDFISTNACHMLYPVEMAEYMAYTLAPFETTAAVTMPPVFWHIYYGLNTVFYGAIFLYLYLRIYKPGLTMQCGSVELAFAAFYPALCVGCNFIIVNYGIDSPQVTLLFVVLAVLFALLFPVFIYYIRISKHFQERTVLQQSYMQQQLSQFNQYKLAQEETSRFRHDIRNNLLCVNDLLHEGKTEEAMEYLHDLLKVSENLRQKYVTGDDMLNCIVGAKSSTFATNKIRFQLDGVLAGGLNWKPIDVCNVFANALDNAVEACLELPEQERYINMTIRSAAQYWFVTIENPTAEAVNTRQLFQKNGSYTSKEGSHHGLGTYNMRRTVESYKGQLNAHCENGQFTLEIMLSKA